MTTPKQETFADGTPYIAAGGWAGFFSWLIDFTVFLLGVAAGFVVLALVDQAVPISDGALVVGLLGLLFAVPLLYGLFLMGRGRALGGVVTGTRLVRTRDGGPVGAKGPWAMLVRTFLLPLLLVAMLAGGGNVDGTIKRVSIHPGRTDEARAKYRIPPL